MPSPADLPNRGVIPGSPALQVDSLPTELSGKPKKFLMALNRSGRTGHPRLVSDLMGKSSKLIQSLTIIDDISCKFLINILCQTVDVSCYSQFSIFVEDFFFHLYFQRDIGLFTHNILGSGIRKMYALLNEQGIFLISFIF